MSQIDPADVIKIAGLKFYAPNKGDTIYKYMLKRNILWESGIIERLCEFITPGSYVVDAGAHVGVHTIKFSKRAKKVFSFEPSPENYRIFEINMELNGVGNVALYNQALCDEESKSFGFDPTKEKKRRSNSGATFLVEDTTGEIEGTTLDTYLSEFDAPVSLIKYDVEEMELQALKGSLETINKFRPALYVEFIKDVKRKRSSSREVKDFLVAAGYSPIEREIWIPCKT